MRNELSWDPLKSTQYEILNTPKLLCEISTEAEKPERGVFKVLKISIQFS